MQTRLKNSQNYYSLWNTRILLRVFASIETKRSHDCGAYVACIFTRPNTSITLVNIIIYVSNAYVTLSIPSSGPIYVVRILF